MAGLPHDEKLIIILKYLFYYKLCEDAHIHFLVAG